MAHYHDSQDPSSVGPQISYFRCTSAHLRQNKNRAINEHPSIMEQQDKEKQAVFDYWWGVPINNLSNAQPNQSMVLVMDALYVAKKAKHPKWGVEMMCQILPAGLVLRAQELGDVFEKKTAGMKPEDKLEFIVGHIDGKAEEDEPAAKRRRHR
jgi:hypothetical protein